MHFDEVYHARTATEFLQDWRYGLPHDIYEWTHPHLAKYAMAAGLVLWGEDDVAATSDLGVPVVAAAVEPRRIDADASRGTCRRAAAHRHRHRDPDLRPADTRPHRGHRGTRRQRPDDRRGRQAAGDRLRGRAHRDAGPRARSATAAASRRASSRRCSARWTTRSAPPRDDRLAFRHRGLERPADVGRARDGQADRLARPPGIADLASGGSGSALVADVDAVGDHAAVASSLADILDGNAADYQTKLDGASPGTTVVLGGAGSGDTRTALDRRSPTGRSTGSRVDTVDRVAVATSSGVAFIDPEQVSRHHDDRPRRAARMASRT